MKLEPIQSSAIKGAGYDPATKTLHVEYTGGGRYAYANVSPEKYKALMSAPSAGKFVAAHIKPRHIGRKL